MMPKLDASTPVYQRVQLFIVIYTAVDIVHVYESVIPICIKCIML